VASAGEIRPEKRRFGEKAALFAFNPGFFAVFEGFWPFWAVSGAAVGVHGVEFLKKWPIPGSKRAPENEKSASFSSKPAGHWEMTNDPAERDQMTNE
jgi:hypothetical protein